MTRLRSQCKKGDRILTVMIKELRAGEHIKDLHALINHVTTGRTNGNNKSTYLTITLQDTSGMIDAKLWSAKPEQIETLVTGCVVCCEGDIIKYGDELQMKLEKIVIVSKEESEQVKYLKNAPLSLEEMEAKLKSYLSQLQSPSISLVTNAIFDEHFSNFLLYPAATRNHHEIVSGLAYHTTCMLDVANSISLIYPSLNKDYLFAGILLHDLGKLFELSGPVVPEYTLQGKLLGHISIVSSLIKEKADELNVYDEDIIILQHLVLSHHGKLEYGSPILPQIKEAEVIYLIDNLDAKINMMDKALEQVEPGHYTKRIFPLDNRCLYRTK